MELQDIKRHLNKPRNWYIVLAPFRKERKTKESLEEKGLVAYLPTTRIGYKWGEKRREIQVPAANRCVFVRATETEITELKATHTILPFEADYQ